MVYAFGILLLIVAGLAWYSFWVLAPQLYTVQKEVRKIQTALKKVNELTNHYQHHTL